MATLTCKVSMDVAEEFQSTAAMYGKSVSALLREFVEASCRGDWLRVSWPDYSGQVGWLLMFVDDALDAPPVEPAERPAVPPIVSIGSKRKRR